MATQIIELSQPLIYGINIKYNNSNSSTFGFTKAQ